MKKTPLLNIALSETIAGLGHGDLLVIADAGLPAPAGVRRIDLALTRGMPPFIDTLKAVLQEMQVGSLILAEETGWVSPKIQAEIQDALPDTPVKIVSHEEFKEITRRAQAIVRTGEMTSYANVILVAGIVF